jgi:hypothetical protein
VQAQRAEWAKSQAIGGPQSMAEMWFGKKHTIVHTKAGPMLQVDRACTVMLAPINLVEFVAKTLRKDAARLTLEDCASANKIIRKSSKLWKIKSSHAKREYKLRGFTTLSAAECMFDLDKESEQPRQMSVAAYFEERFGVHHPVRRTDLPCAMVGKAKDPNAILIPMELCSFTTCQPAPVNAEVQQQQITLTSEPPRPRFDKIKAIQQALLRDSRRPSAPTSSRRAPRSWSRRSSHTTTRAATPPR